MPLEELVPPAPPLVPPGVLDELVPPADPVPPAAPLVPAPPAPAAPPALLLLVSAEPDVPPVPPGVLDALPDVDGLPADDEELGDEVLGVVADEDELEGGVLVLPALPAAGALSFLPQAPNASAATNDASNTEYFILEPSRLSPLAKHIHLFVHSDLLEEAIAG